MTDRPGTPADLDRRLTAYAVDRLIGWGIAAGLGYAGWRLLVAPGQVWVAFLVAAAALAVIGVAVAVLTGTTGLTPGKAVTGLRVVRRSDGRPIGVGPALLRTLVIAAAGLPTAGLGVAMLGWTAAVAPQRRGWHDRFGDALVVDDSAAPTPPDQAAAAPSPVVNLTALRLAPGPAVDLRREATPAPLPAEVDADTRPPPDPAPTVRRPVRPVPEPAGRWWVAFDTGEEFAVAGSVLVGRRPEPRPGEEMWRAVALRSDDMSISKTHAQFRVTPDGALVVMDRGSTNGTYLVRQGLSKALSPGRPSTLLVGDRVRFGDREMVVSSRD